MPKVNIYTDMQLKKQSTDVQVFLLTSPCSLISLLLSSQQALTTLQLTVDGNHITDVSKPITRAHPKQTNAGKYHNNDEASP